MVYQSVSTAQVTTSWQHHQTIIIDCIWLLWLYITAPRKSSHGKIGSKFIEGVCKTWARPRPTDNKFCIFTDITNKNFLAILFWKFKDWMETNWLEVIKRWRSSLTNVGSGSKIPSVKRLKTPWRYIFPRVDCGRFRSQFLLTETNHVNYYWTPFMERHVFDSIRTAGLCI